MTSKISKNAQRALKRVTVLGAKSRGLLAGVQVWWTSESVLTILDGDKVHVFKGRWLDPEADCEDVLHALERRGEISWEERTSACDFLEAKKHKERDDKRIADALLVLKSCGYTGPLK